MGGRHIVEERLPEVFGDGGADVRGRVRSAAVRVQLRAVREGDLETFFEHQQDPDANRMAAFPATEKGAFMAHWAAILRAETVLTLTVLVDGEVAGNVVSFEHAGKREVGYWIGSGFWGRGVATIALSEFLRHETARPLYAGVASHNVGSRRALEKCAFVLATAENDPGDERDEDVEFVVFELHA